MCIFVWLTAHCPLLTWLFLYIYPISRGSLSMSVCKCIRWQSNIQCIWYLLYIHVWYGKIKPSYGNFRQFWRDLKVNWGQFRVIHPYFSRCYYNPHRIRFVYIYIILKSVMRRHICEGQFIALKSFRRHTILLTCIASSLSHIYSVITATHSNIACNRIYVF